MFKKLMVATAVLMLVTATGNTAKMEEPAAAKLNTTNFEMSGPSVNEMYGPSATKFEASYIVYKPVDERQAEDAVTEVKPAAEEIFSGLYPNEDYDKTIIVLAKLLWGEARGVRSDTNKACVIWCILNRVDKNMRGDTVIECATASHQFNYNKRFPVKESLKKIAKDVLDRWLLEKTGEKNVGRVLPKNYCFFSGNGRHNVFRNQYKIHGSKKLKPIRSKVYGH